jgi:hypothetical protein
MQPDLVRRPPAERLTLEEEPLVERDLAVVRHVRLGHPRADAAGTELVVPGPVQRVCRWDHDNFQTERCAWHARS